MNLKHTLVFMAVATALARPAGAESNWYGTPKLGLSNFTGNIGAEAQYKHWALAIGAPLAGGVKYYFHPSTHGWYGGAYGSGWGYSDDKVIDGVAYTDYSRIGGGVGGGYRWFWKERWSLVLGLTAGYLKQRWTHGQSGHWREETGVQFFPDLALGFSFR